MLLNIQVTACKELLQHSADAGASMTVLKRHGGWRSTTVPEGYLEDSISSKNKISKMLSGEPSTSASTIESIESSSVTSGNITFTGSFNNCNFSVNDTK